VMCLLPGNGWKTSFTFYVLRTVRTSLKRAITTIYSTYRPAGRTFMTTSNIFIENLSQNKTRNQE
jgi:hypothetical protein